MSNHLTPIDRIALKVNEIIRVMNSRGRHNWVEEPKTKPGKPVKYPEYSRTKIDHTKLGG